jgi:hypothetical protein
VPINTLDLKIYLLSSDKEDMGTEVSITGLTDFGVKTSQVCPGNYVAAIYNHDYYTGRIIADNDEECHVLIKFMKRKGQDRLTFSRP